MITESQLTEIRNYLLSKNLPIDILLEVQDHFISQISDLQREGNLNFEEAFQKTKSSWDKELKPYWKGGLSLEDVSDFMRRMRKENELSNLRWALKWGLISMVVIFLSAFVLEGVYFGIFVVSVLSSLILYSLFRYFGNLQTFMIAKKYENYVLTLHQHSIIIFLLVLSPMIDVFSRFLQEPERYKEIMMLKGEFGEFFFLNISVAIIVFGVFFSLSAQKNYLRQIEKVKPFLQYLKPSN